MSADIDIVIPHVDGSAPGYQALCRERTGSWVPCHVRDLGELRYVLRSMERFAPWVESVTLVVQSDGHVPAWLDRTRLRIVRHEEFIPRAHLPTFHWATIAAYMHRIEGLSERFVIWDDDQLLGRPLAASDLFDEDGLPRAMRTAPIWPALGAVVKSTYQLNLINTARALDRRIGPGPTFLYPHMPRPVSRATWARMHEAMLAVPEFVDTVTRNARGDERARPTVEPHVLFANWVERAERGRGALRGYAACALDMAARGAVALLPAALRARVPFRAAGYGIVNDPERTRRRMARLAAERPTFINVNDEAYDSWVVDGVDLNTAEMPNPESLAVFHATMERLYPTPSRFELRAPSGRDTTAR